MKRTVFVTCVVFSLISALAVAAVPRTNQNAVKGRYLEARSCDVFAGACYANSETGLTGREAILAWNVTEGSWNGTALDGLNVVAVVRAGETLGYASNLTGETKSTIILDSAATEAQRVALTDMAKALAGKLVANVVETKQADFEAELGTCDKTGACARLKAGDLVTIETRCIGGKDHMCGNESLYYPPLTGVDNAVPAYTTTASYKGNALGVTWTDMDKRSAFVATFAN
jgi:hypothetical protein